MRSLLALLLLVLVGCPKSGPLPVPLPKDESTLTWDRTSDAHLYVVYACWTKDCPVPNQAIGTVLQLASSTPEYTVYLFGKTGAFAVSARDAQGHESGLSNVVRFDRR